MLTETLGDFMINVHYTLCFLQTWNKRDTLYSYVMEHFSNGIKRVNASYSELNLVGK